MAKQQYYFRKKPTPLFPAFNPAVIDVMPSMFAYLQAQAIISAGASNNEYGDTVNLYPLAEDTTRKAWPGNEGNINTYGIYPFVRPDANGGLYTGGETASESTKLLFPSSPWNRKYQFNADGLAFAGWGDLSSGFGGKPQGNLRSVVEYVDSNHALGTVSVKNIPVSSLFGEIPETLKPRLVHTVNIGDFVPGMSYQNPNFYWYFDARKVRNTPHGMLGWPVYTAITGANVSRLASGAGYYDLSGISKVTGTNAGTVEIFVSSPNDSVEDRYISGGATQGTTALESTIFESPLFAVCCRWNSTAKTYGFYIRYYTASGQQESPVLYTTTPDEPRDIHFVIKHQNATFSVNAIDNEGITKSFNSPGLGSNPLFSKTVIGCTGAQAGTVSTGSGTTPLYFTVFPGITRHVRLFSTVLTEDAITELQNGGKPEDFIMPRVWQTAYGCYGEFLGQFFRLDSSPFLRPPRITNSCQATGTSVSTVSFTGSNVSIFKASVRETVADGGYDMTNSHDIVKPDYCLYASRLFIGTYTSSASPWTLSPWYILANYDPTNFTPATIKVTPEHPNEDVPPVTVGVKVGDSAIEQQRYVGDIAKIARRLFKNVVDELEQQDFGLGMPTMPLYVDYNLIARISVDKVGQFAGLNAVRQLGADEFTTRGGYFAVDNPVKYPGYPLNLVFINTQWGGDNVVIIVGGEDLGNMKGAGILMAQPLALIKVQDGSTHFIAASLSNDGVSDEIEIGSGCVGDHPFYVQWINDRGGYNSYMFNTRNTVETERTDTVNVQRADISDEFDTQVTASFKIERRITTGVDNLTREEYDKLLGIFKSPRIQWWNEEAEQWVTVLGGDQSNTWDTNSGLGSIEVTFIYPRILLQQ